MYLLNDKHDEYEYALYICVEGACPYISPDSPFKEHKIKEWIKYIEKKHKNPYNANYYIDNDFYHNEQKIAHGTYYKFLRRKINDWKPFNTKENGVYIPYLKAL